MRLAKHPYFCHSNTRGCVCPFVKPEIIAAVESSLQRLQTDYLDVCIIHAVNEVERLMAPTFHEAFDRLREQGIYARRYFHPLIADLPTYSDAPSAQPGELPVARDIAARVLCLPMFPDLDPENQQRVIDVIREQI